MVLDCITWICNNQFKVIYKNEYLKFLPHIRNFRYSDNLISLTMMRN